MKNIVYKIYILPLIASMLSIMLALTMNYLMTGLIDITPLSFTYKYMNTAILSKWLSPYVLLHDTSYEILRHSLSDYGGSESIILSKLEGLNLLATLKMLLYLLCYGPPIINISVYCALLGILLIIVLQRNDRNDILDIMMPFLAGYLAIYATIVILTNYSPYLRSISTILLFLKTMVLILPLVYCVGQKRRITGYIAAIAILLHLALVSGGIIYRYPKGALDITTGRIGFSTFYSYYWPHMVLCEKIHSIVGRGEKIELLNFFPGCYVIPNNNFQRPLMTDYNKNKEFTDIMYEDLASAKKVIDKYGIRYFLVDLSQDICNDIVYSSIFRQSNMKDNLTVSWSSDKVYLLTWKNIGDKPLDDAFIDMLTGKCNGTSGRRYFEVAREAYTAERRGELQLRGY
ncbi:hypothetical protein [Candidatus Magnetominusculus xianensis]|nr:hypothetical protein [Candidatus Magnetominusculus xianensis]MBF0402893.1 hypothetical protein [Nitrospirota bacterium]